MSKTQVKLSPNEISEKWARRLKAAIPDIVAGIGKVTDDPGQAAVNKQDKMLANLTARVQDGTWAKRRLEVSMDEWKKKTIDKVQQRLGGGVDGAQAKRQNFDSWLVNKLNNILPGIDAMPDLTMEDSVNRVRALMEGMAKDRYKAQ